MLVSDRSVAPGESRTRVMSDRWDLTVATEHPTRPGSKLQNNDLLQDSWAAYNQRQSGTWVSLSAAADTSAEERTVGVVAMLGANRKTFTPPDPGETYLPNQVRVRCDRNPLADRIRPGIASIALTNLTGSISDISGPIDPPQFPITAGYVSTRLLSVSAASNTVVTVTFDAHHGAGSTWTTIERLLSGTQLIRVHVRDSVGVASYPTIAVVLRQSGSDIATLSEFNDTEKTSEGFIFTYDFDAALLTSTTGAVGCRITGTTTGTSTPEVIGVEWVTELAGLDFDSDWVDAGENIYTLPDFVIPPGAPFYVHIEWSDYCIESITTVSGHVVRILDQLDSVFYAGRVVVSGLIEHEFVSPSGLNWRRTSDVPFARSRLGGMRSNRVALQFKEADILLPFIPNSELLERWEIFLDSIGMKTPFLFIPDPTRKECYWVVCTSWNSDHVGYFTGDGDSDERYDLAFSIAEHQAMLAPRG